jgi:hypothetical protein
MWKILYIGVSAGVLGGIIIFLLSYRRGKRKVAPLSWKREGVIDIYLHCDKCGTMVHPSNNAYMFLAILEERNTNNVRLGRHLLPVPGCEGSPSSAQYLPGQPQDMRGVKKGAVRPYNFARENKYRQAHERLLQKFPPA